jgi:hypothetical protein
VRRPELGVVLAGLLVGVVGDTAGVRQQVEQIDLDRDPRPGEVDVVVDARLEVEVRNGCPW